MGARAVAWVFPMTPPARKTHFWKDGSGWWATVGPYRVHIPVILSNGQWVDDCWRRPK